jgi:ligand-binding SRPBCC domain-containing protein
MTIRVCERSVWVPAPLDEVFDFFSDANNLERLTPPFLQFKVLTPGPIVMKPGALIDYKLKLRGIPIRWRTEICDWQPGKNFIDKQLKGPYRQWIHTHIFETKDGGTRVSDRVEYAIPGGLLEPLIFPLVRRDVEGIFDYRSKVIAELFGHQEIASSTSLTSLRK